MKNLQPDERAHWARRYVGRPFLSGGAGPAGYDCWGLVRAFYAQAHGVRIPPAGRNADDLRDVRAGFADNRLYGGWEKVRAPHDGDAVLMRQGRHVCHVGLWADIDGGRVVHAMPGVGVTAMKDVSVAGYEIDSFWRWRGLRNRPQSI